MDKVFLARTAAGTDVFIGKDTYDHMQAHPDVSVNNPV